MQYPSIFDSSTTEMVLSRLEKLQPETQPEWGKMDAAQMLAHLNVAYDQAYGTGTVKYNPLMKLMLKLFVKKIVVGPKPYKRNSRTAPSFLIADARDFEKEKAKLIDHVRTTEGKGRKYFEGKASAGFGKLTSGEWNILFYKHLDHHFTQFGL